MTNTQEKLGARVWKIADNLGGVMNADDFRNGMLSFLIGGNKSYARLVSKGGSYPLIIVLFLLNYKNCYLVST